MGNLLRARVQLRRTTAAEWASKNPVLLDGEQGLETDTGRTKTGNGASAWSALAYSGGGAPSALSFAQSIAFTTTGYMPDQTVTGAIAFVASGAGAVEGAQVTVDLIANGTHAPTFTGFREWGGSSGYVNAAGVRNCITFFRRSGISYYSIAQQLGAAPEPIAPGAVQSFTATTSTTTTQTLTWVNPLVGSTPFSFLLEFKLSSSGTWTTVSSAATSPATVTGLSASTSYDYRVTASNALGTGPATTLTGISTPGAGAIAMRLNTLLNLAESGDGTAGWNYLAVAAGFNNGGRADHSFAAGADGTFEGSIANGSNVILCVDPDPGHATSVFTTAYGIWGNADGSVNEVTSGSFPTIGGVTHTGTYKLRMTRTGSTLVAAIWDGSTWTDIKTWTGVSTGVLYAGIAMADVGSTVSNLRCTGLV